MSTQDGHMTYLINTMMKKSEPSAPYPKLLQMLLNVLYNMSINCDMISEKG